MAIGNAVRQDGSSGYILVGVDEDPTTHTGKIVGIDPSTHLDDAAMQEKVKNILHRRPVFSYSPVEVDGMSVGVFEIRGGGRPFFPLRDQGNRRKLKRFEAQIRVGSSTDVASPDQIASWVRADEQTERQRQVHDGISQVLGFLVEAIDGSPFHWSKHALYCEPLRDKMNKVRDIKGTIDGKCYVMSPFQRKCVVESAHEVQSAVSALISAAFQLSSKHGLIWLSLNNCVSCLARLFPYKVELEPLEPRLLVFGDGAFSFAFYELLEHMILFDDARRNL